MRIVVAHLHFGIRLMQKLLNSAKEMKSMPLVSIIMAVYHVAALDQLDAAISSVLRQTFADIELIICDDGAEAETARALAEWSQKDARIVLIHNKRNFGAGPARNRAAQVATGVYLAIMDADDISAQTRIEKQLAFLLAHPEVDFVGTRGSFFCHSPDDDTGGYWCVPQPKAKDFLMTLPFVHASILFRRDVFFAAGGYREVFYVRRSEDYDLLMRLYERKFCGANLPDTLYHIRRDEGTYHRRKYRYRFLECAVKLIGFTRLGLMPKGILFAVKPLVVGLIPAKLLEKYKQKYYR